MRPAPPSEPPRPALNLPWDFINAFPAPLDEAIDAGVIDSSDTTPEGLRSLHEEYGRQAIETLHARDRLADAKRRNVDPATGKPPRTEAARERLAKSLADARERQDHSFDILMLTYADAFGQEAADAFAKAIRARHAGIEVSTASRGNNRQEAAATTPKKVKPRRVSTVLPVPKPLAAAVAAGHFGHEENGRPIRPGPVEVRAITEDHAQRMIDLLAELNTGCADREAICSKYAAAMTAYAEDFGEQAAARLDAHVLHEADRRARPSTCR